MYVRQMRALAFIGGIIGAVVVTLSLVYLVVQDKLRFNWSMYEAFGALV